MIFIRCFNIQFWNCLHKYWPIKLPSLYCVSCMYVVITTLLVLPDSMSTHVCENIYITKEGISYFRHFGINSFKRRLVYTWNVISTLYRACTMSCISFMNGIWKVNHFKAIFLLVYIPDSRVLICYQYLYGATDVDGTWCMLTRKNGQHILLLPKIISTTTS